jgi:hypothetical protein
VAPAAATTQRRIEQAVSVIERINRGSSQRDADEAPFDTNEELIKVASPVLSTTNPRPEPPGVRLNRSDVVVLG